MRATTRRQSRAGGMKAVVAALNVTRGAGYQIPVAGIERPRGQGCLLGHDVVAVAQAGAGWRDIDVVRLRPCDRDTVGGSGVGVVDISAIVMLVPHEEVARSREGVALPSHV